MKIFLDVGANTGQTARAALDPAYAFDRIVSFEPAPVCWPQIEAIGDKRVELCRFGLSDRAGNCELHDPGTLGASVYGDLEHTERTSEKVSIALVRASEWFAKNLSADDLVFMKINCEGSECDIVEDLFASGELRKAYNVMISFDVRHSPTLRGREAPLRAKLRRAGYRNLSFSEDVMRGTTHEARIHSWLHRVGAHERLSRAELERKYAATLKDLSRRSGRLARVEQSLREHVFKRLPPPLKAVSRAVWGRLMRGHRAGPE